MGEASSELFAQFLMRIYKEIREVRSLQIFQL